MYTSAYKKDGQSVIYYDEIGYKYIFQGGNLSWRLNNPGLVSSHSHVAGFYNAIGTCDGYAIFKSPEDGHKALSDWLHFKKYQMGNLRGIAKHYQPENSEDFAKKLSGISNINIRQKIKNLNNAQYEKLLFALEKLCGYFLKGDEQHLILPRIIGKVEYPQMGDEGYLIEGYQILTKQEAIEWIKSDRLDALIVEPKKATTYLRSRPKHCCYPPSSFLKKNVTINKEIGTLIRVVGGKRVGQCVWGFVNGISNSRESALRSACLISDLTEGEEVLYMPNDQTLGGLVDLLVAAALKFTIDMPIVDLAVKFFKYLLHCAKKEHSLVVLFVHSQSAIIAEHALRHLSHAERVQIRIFNFGGASYILPGLTHPDSHNYASSNELVNFIGSPYLRTLAMERFNALKKGITEVELIESKVKQDLVFYVDSTNCDVVESFCKERKKYYKGLFSNISNVTILDSENKRDHEFAEKCYQQQLRLILKKYKLSGASLSAI